MKQYKVYLFDADDTLRTCTVEGQNCPYKEGEWEILPGVKEKLASLPGNPVFGVVSNQGGVASGKVPYGVAHKMLVQTAEAAFPRGSLRLSLIKFCPHSSKGKCVCRKPSPYMILDSVATAMMNYSGFGDLQLTEVLFVGDADTDKEAAERAGVDFMWAHDFFGYPQRKPSNFTLVVDHTIPNP